MDLIGSGNSSDPPLSIFEICMTVLLLISYFLIVILFCIIFQQRRFNKRIGKYSMVEEDHALKLVNRTNNTTSNQNMECKDDGNDTTSYNVIPTTQLVGLDVSLTNPNYMSTAPQPSSLMQERETKRLSLLSEFHHTHCLSADRHDGGTPQSIALRNVRASYAAIPLPVTDEVVEEDVYSLVADEHNYSCISSTEEDILGHLSSDSGREEGSEHNYSCINSRSCSHLSSVSSDMKNKEPFDYEEFYSIANVDKETISESDGENDHKNTDREEIAEDDNAFYISTDVDHRRKSLHVPLPSYPVPIATCTRKRSVTSNDIFGLVGATSDDINITMWPEVITKPTPKPRKPRNWNSVSLLND